MYTQQEVDDLLAAQRERLEERFDVERICLTRLVDMHAHKNAQYQEVIATMSAEIMRKNEIIGRANGEILALRQASLLSMRMARCPLPCSMQAGRAFV
jgi:hypothetical protein